LVRHWNNTLEKLRKFYNDKDFVPGTYSSIGNSIGEWLRENVQQLLSKIRFDETQLFCKSLAAMPGGI
jgi:hypothetical protein